MPERRVRRRARDGATVEWQSSREAFRVGIGRSSFLRQIIPRAFAEDRVELVGCLTRLSFPCVRSSQLDPIREVSGIVRHPGACFTRRGIERRTHRSGELLDLGVPGPQRSQPRQLDLGVAMPVGPRQSARQPQVILESIGLGRHEAAVLRDRLIVLLRLEEHARVLGANTAGV